MNLKKLLAPILPLLALHVLPTATDVQAQALYHEGKGLYVSVSSGDVGLSVGYRVNEHANVSVYAGYEDAAGDDLELAVSAGYSRHFEGSPWGFRAVGALHAFRLALDPGGLPLALDDFGPSVSTSLFRRVDAAADAVFYPGAGIFASAPGFDHAGPAGAYLRMPIALQVSPGKTLVFTPAAVAAYDVASGNSSLGTSGTVSFNF